MRSLPVWLSITILFSALAAGCGGSSSDDGSRGGGGSSGGEAVESYTALNHPTAGLTIDVPTSWQLETDDDVMTISAPDGSVSIIFSVFPESELETAVGMIDDHLQHIITGMQFEPAQESTVNGLPVLYADGTGYVQGTPIDLGMAIVATPTQQALLVLGISAQGAVAAHQEVIRHVLQSIRPM